MTQFEDNRSPYLTLVEQGSEPSTPATGTQRLFIDSADGKLYRIDESDVVTEVGGSAGGTAPGDGKYIVSSSHVDLSDEIVIPGMAGSPDRAGIGGGGSVYEFDSGASPLTWSAAVDTENVNSTFPSHLYVQDNGAAATFGTFAYAPAGAFDIRCKMSLGGEVGTSASTIAGGLIVASSGLSNRAFIEIEYAGASDRFIVAAYTYTGGVATQRGASQGDLSNCEYLRIKRDGSNNVSFYVSHDGLTWLLIATQSFTFTPAAAGIVLVPASLTTEIAVDFIRSTV